LKKELNSFFHSVVREETIGCFKETIGCFKETIGCFSTAAKQILNFKNLQIGFNVDEIKYLTRDIKHEYEFKKN